MCIEWSKPALADCDAAWAHAGSFLKTWWWLATCLHRSCPNDKGSTPASRAAAFLGFSLPPSKTFSDCLLTQPPRRPHSASRSLKHGPKFGAHSCLQLSFVSFCTGSVIDGQHPCSHVSCKLSSFIVIKSSRSVSNWMAPRGFCIKQTV